ncbi:uncharacterized protein [Musca autumnalis]|uniref:uncharacterized protein n=1 Tax=Musca autumnalis TaxID=221902 RepID=UPI003CE77058
MFKYVAVLAFLAVAQAAPGFVSQSHTYVQPAVYTAPVVKTVATPVVHSYVSTPVVKTVVTPVVHQTYVAAPVVKHITTPVVHTYAAAPVVKTVVHSAPLVKTVPVVYASGFHH